MHAPIRSSASASTEFGVVPPLSSEAYSALPPTAARLVRAVQDLSLAHSIEAVREIVRHAARELTHADGATFVLRDGEQCYYFDEDAIAPLWKGQRFPMEACVSGWAMRHGEPVVIEDVFADPRVPVDAYRRTFVQSLVMVPIRAANPIGAIGNYWSQSHRATDEEVQVLQALASTTAVALENVRVYGELEKRVRERTRQLENANEELQSFSASVSHDLRAPLAIIAACADLLRLTSADALDAKARELLLKIPTQVTRMSALIDDLLRLARIREAELNVAPVDLTALAHEIARELRGREPERAVEFVAPPSEPVEGDAPLLRIALENLLSNAWKFTRHTPGARVELGHFAHGDGVRTFYVRDNGAGFAMAEATKLFTPFRRLHHAADYAGTGVGLTIVARVIDKHGGRIWAEARPGEGATFSFTLGSAR
ncbi:MAG: GAF domain-containing protein [Opitutae bacterium]|nr:GAF domain-containing protein [Opitutae bacterium]